MPSVRKCFLYLVIFWQRKRFTFFMKMQRKLFTFYTILLTFYPCTDNLVLYNVKMIFFEHLVSWLYENFHLSEQIRISHHSHQFPISILAVSSHSCIMSKLKLNAERGNNKPLPPEKKKDVNNRIIKELRRQPIPKKQLLSMFILW